MALRCSDTCTHPFTGSVNTETRFTMRKSSYDSMGSFDMVALYFAAFTIGTGIAGELKDIGLCHTSMRNAGDALGGGWRAAATVINVLRRWVVMPPMLATAGTLVMQGGSGAKDICLNVVGAFTAQIWPAR